MLESSFRIGTVAGIRIGVHYTWFIVFLLLSSALASFFRETHPEWDGSTVLITALVTTLMYFVSIVLHELGHSLVAIARGIQVRTITLFIFGGMAQTEKESDSAATEFYIAIAGPMVSFALAALFYLLQIWAISSSIVVAEAFNWLATINFVLAVFNLIPGFPLDGGRVLRAVVWKITGNTTKGMQWAVISGKAVAYGLIVLGALVGLQPGMLLNGIWLMAIGWFLFAAAEGSKRAYLTERLATHIRVGDVMQKQIPTTAAEISILNWVDEHMLLTGQRSSLVINNEQIIGLITLNDVIQHPRSEWTNISVHTIMTPIEQLYTTKPTDSIHEVLKLFRQHNINQVPVMSDGNIIGWIDREHLLKILQLHDLTGR